MKFRSLIFAISLSILSTPIEAKSKDSISNDFTQVKLSDEYYFRNRIKRLRQLRKSKTKQKSYRSKLKDKKQIVKSSKSKASKAVKLKTTTPNIKKAEPKIRRIEATPKVSKNSIDKNYFRKKYTRAKSIRKQQNNAKVKAFNGKQVQGVSRLDKSTTNDFEKYYFKSTNETKKIVPISIEGLVRDVVRFNANSIYQNIQNKISEHQIDYERGILDPNFMFNVRRSDTENPNNAEQSLSRSFQDKYLERKSDYELGLSGLSVDGLQWNVKMTYNKRASSIIDQLRGYNREHENGIDLSLRQPLLKGKGKDMTLIKINIAKMTKKISVDQYRKKIMDLIGVTIQSYWRLYGAQKLYQSWSESLKIANNQLMEMTEKVKSGMNPKTDLLEIKSAISLRKIELYAVENQILQYQNQILSLLNLSATKNQNILLKAVGNPNIANTSIPSLENSFKEAVENWPEFRVAVQKIEMEKLKIRFAKNQSKAQFDLTGNVNSNNLHDASTFAYKSALSKDSISWYLGLEYRIPLNNTASKNNIAIEDLRMRQARLELDSLYRSLNNGLHGKINKLISTRDQLLELQNGMAIKRRLLDISKQKMHFGKARIRDIFDQQEKLINYQRKILSGVVEMKLAKASLDKAVGALLDRFDVEVESAREDLEIFEDTTYTPSK